MSTADSNDNLSLELERTREETKARYLGVLKLRQCYCGQHDSINRRPQSPIINYQEPSFFAQEEDTPSAVHAIPRNTFIYYGLDDSKPSTTTAAAVYNTPHPTTTYEKEVDARRPEKYKNTTAAPQQLHLNEEFNKWNEKRRSLRKTSSSHHEESKPYDEDKRTFSLYDNLSELEALRDGKKQKIKTSSASPTSSSLIEESQQKLCISTFYYQKSLLEKHFKKWHDSTSKDFTKEDNSISSFNQEWRKIRCISRWYSFYRNRKLLQKAEEQYKYQRYNIALKCWERCARIQKENYDNLLKATSHYSRKKLQCWKMHFHLQKCEKDRKSRALAFYQFGLLSKSFKTLASLVCNWEALKSARNFYKTRLVTKTYGAISDYALCKSEIRRRQQNATTMVYNPFAKKRFLRRWKESYQRLLIVKYQVEDAVEFYTEHTLHKMWRQWKLYIKLSKSQYGKQCQAEEHYHQKTKATYWRNWKYFVADLQHEAIATYHCEKNLLYKFFHNLRSYKEERGKKNRVRQGAYDMNYVKRRIFKSIDKWKKWTNESQRHREKLEKSLRHAQQQKLQVCFKAWSNLYMKYVAQKSRMYDFMTVRSNRVVQKCFTTLKQRVCDKSHLEMMARYYVHKRIMHWKHYTQSLKRNHYCERKATRWYSTSKLSIGFTTVSNWWRRKKRWKDKNERALTCFKTNLMRRILPEWRKRSFQKRVSNKKKVLARRFVRAKQRGKCFTIWCTYVLHCRKKKVQNHHARYLFTLSQLLKSFRNWTSFTETQIERRLQLTEATEFANHRRVEKVWKDWLFVIRMLAIHRSKAKEVERVSQLCRYMQAVRRWKQHIDFKIYCKNVLQDVRYRRENEMKNEMMLHWQTFVQSRIILKVTSRMAQIKLLRLKTSNFITRWRNWTVKKSVLESELSIGDMHFELKCKKNALQHFTKILLSGRFKKQQDGMLRSIYVKRRLKVCFGYWQLAVLLAFTENVQTLQAIKHLKMQRLLKFFKKLWNYKKYQRQKQVASMWFVENLRQGAFNRWRTTVWFYIDRQYALAKADVWYLLYQKKVGIQYFQRNAARLTEFRKFNNTVYHHVLFKTFRKIVKYGQGRILRRNKKAIVDYRYRRHVLRSYYKDWYQSVFVDMAAALVFSFSFYSGKKIEKIFEHWKKVVSRIKLKRKKIFTSLYRWMYHSAEDAFHILKKYMLLRQFHRKQLQMAQSAFESQKLRQFVTNWKSYHKTRYGVRWQVRAANNTYQKTCFRKAIAQWKYLRLVAHSRELLMDHVYSHFQNVLVRRCFNQLRRYKFTRQRHRFNNAVISLELRTYVIKKCIRRWYTKTQILRKLVKEDLVAQNLHSRTVKYEAISRWTESLHSLKEMRKKKRSATTHNCKRLKFGKFQRWKEISENNRDERKASRFLENLFYNIYMSIWKLNAKFYKTQRELNHVSLKFYHKMLITRSFNVLERYRKYRKRRFETLRFSEPHFEKSVARIGITRWHNFTRESVLMTSLRVRAQEYYKDRTLLRVLYAIRRAGVSQRSDRLVTTEIKTRQHFVITQHTWCRWKLRIKSNAKLERALSDASEFRYVKVLGRAFKKMIQYQKHKLWSRLAILKSRDHIKSSQLKTGISRWVSFQRLVRQQAFIYNEARKMHSKSICKNVFASIRRRNDRKLQFYTTLGNSIENFNQQCEVVGFEVWFSYYQALQKTSRLVECGKRMRMRKLMQYWKVFTSECTYERKCEDDASSFRVFHLCKSVFTLWELNVTKKWVFNQLQHVAIRQYSTSVLKKSLRQWKHEHKRFKWRIRRRVFFRQKSAVLLRNVLKSWHSHWNVEANGRVLSQYVEHRRVRKTFYLWKDQYVSSKQSIRL